MERIIIISIFAFMILGVLGYVISLVLNLIRISRISGAAIQKIGVSGRGILFSSIGLAPLVMVFQSFRTTANPADPTGKIIMGSMAIVFAALGIIGLFFPLMIHQNGIVDCGKFIAWEQIKSYEWKREKLILHKKGGGKMKIEMKPEHFLDVKPILEGKVPPKNET